MLAEAMEEMEEIVQSFKSKIRRKQPRIKDRRTPGFKVKTSSKGRNRNKCK